MIRLPVICIFICLVQICISDLVGCSIHFPGRNFGLRHRCLGTVEGKCTDVLYFEGFRVFTVPTGEFNPDNIPICEFEDIECPLFKKEDDDNQVIKQLSYFHQFSYSGNIFYFQCLLPCDPDVLDFVRNGNSKYEYLSFELQAGDCFKGKEYIRATLIRKEFAYNFASHLPYERFEMYPKSYIQRNIAEEGLLQMYADAKMAYEDKTLHFDLLKTNIQTFSNGPPHVKYESRTRPIKILLTDEDSEDAENNGAWESMIDGYR